jgi:hypothetical protein
MPGRIENRTQKKTLFTRSSLPDILVLSTFYFRDWTEKNCYLSFAKKMMAMNIARKKIELIEWLVSI